MPTGQISIDSGVLSAIAKEVFPAGSEIFSNVERSTPAFDLLDSGSNIPFMGKWEDGKYLVFPVETSGGQNPSVPMSELGGFPSAQNVSLDRLTCNVATMSQAFNYSGLAEDTLAMGNDSSVVNGVKYQMQQLLLDARKRGNYYLHQDGSGLLATPSNVASGNTITVDSTAYLAVGTEIYIVGLTTGTLYTGQTSGTALKVSAVNSDTEIVVTDENDQAVTLSDGAVSGYGIYAYGTSQGKAPHGFGIICSSANPTNWGGGTNYYMGKTRSGNDWHQAYQVNIGGRMVDIQRDIQPFMSTLKKRAGQWLGTNGHIAFSGYDVYWGLYNAMQTDKRTMTKTVMLEGMNGEQYEALDLYGAKLVIDNDAPPTKIRFVHKASCRRYILRPWGWLTKTGAQWQQGYASDGRANDTYVARMLTRWQMLSVRDKTHGEMHGIAASN